MLPRRGVFEQAVDVLILCYLKVSPKLKLKGDKIHIENKQTNKIFEAASLSTLNIPFLAVYTYLFLLNFTSSTKPNSFRTCAEFWILKHSKSLFNYSTFHVSKFFSSSVRNYTFAFESGERFCIENTSPQNPFFSQSIKSFSF